MTKREYLEAILWGFLHPFATNREHHIAAEKRARKYHPELFKENQ